MASSGNFATIGGLEKNTGGFTFSQGNLKYAVSTNQRGFILSQGVPESGKYYWEVRVTQYGGSEDQVHIGVCQPDKMRGNLTGSRGGAQVSGGGGYTFDQYNGAAWLDGSKQSDDSIGNLRTTPQIFGFAIDRDNNTFKWTYNGSTYSSTYTIPSSGALYPYIGSGGGSNTASGVFNFGQDSTFGGAISAGGNADSNGFGDFTFSVPSNYVALSSANIPISSDIDPAETDDDIPTKQFGAAAYSGNSGTQSINLGFQPDLIWTKIREASDSRIVDSTRGTDNYLISNNNNAEATVTTGVTGFTSTGYNLGSDGIYNGSSYTYVSWNWRANGGTTASNDSGDITSTVQANTKSGFSIVTYTGNGGVAQSIGHGLSSGAPEFIIVKNRSAGDDWAVYHHSLGNAAHMILNSNAAQVTSSAYWGSFTPTTTLFKVGSDHKLNASSENYVAYLWHSVEGMQRFGTYEGNQNADGPFIYTGFRPRMIFMKNADTNSTELAVSDSARDTSNPIGPQLNWDNNNAEGADKDVDFLSNGFKIRKYTGAMNDSGTHIYGAWGDVPFKYNNTL